MLQSIAIILGAQTLGELINRLTGVSVPGPVIGMLLLLIAFFLWDGLIDRIRPTAGVLLAHLSLLFVPAGVGIIRHGERFMNEGVAIAVTIAVTSVVAMLVTIAAVKGTERLLHLTEKEED